MQSTPINYFTAQSYDPRQELSIIPMNTFFQPKTQNSSGNFFIAPATNANNSQPIYSISFTDNSYGQPTDQRQWVQYQPNVPLEPPPYAEVIRLSPTNSNPTGKVNKVQNAVNPFTPGYKWPRRSVQLVCPKCGATVVTRIEKSITFITVLSALILLILTCFLACIPFCIAACKKTTHYCPYCNSLLGKRSALR